MDMVAILLLSDIRKRIACHFVDPKFINNKLHDPEMKEGAVIVGSCTGIDLGSFTKMTRIIVEVHASLLSLFPTHNIRARKLRWDN